METSRRDEPPGRYFRSDRVIMTRGQWYIVTRERMDIGPYPTREEAAEAAAQLIQALDGIDDPVVVMAFINEFSRRRVETFKKRRVANG
jgi:hypothetical protein